MFKFNGAFVSAEASARMDRYAQWARSQDVKYEIDHNHCHRCSGQSSCPNCKGTGAPMTIMQYVTEIEIRDAWLERLKDKFLD
jgi:hypothetical protein